MSNALATIDLIQDNVNMVSKAGKAYTCMVLTYTINGEQKEKKILDKYLRDHVKNNLRAGDLVRLGFGRTDTGFMNLAEITKVNPDEVAESMVEMSEPTPTKTSMQRRVETQFNNTDREIGMQVGNALTNASTLLAAGKMPEGMPLMEVAEHVLRIGNALKQKLMNGEFD